jgi:hypothetical protein
MGIGGFRPLVGGSHLLNALGINSNEVFEQLNAIQQRMGLLQQLGNGFQASGGLQPSALAGLLQQGNIPAAGAMPPPNAGGCGCGGFANAKELDLGSSPPGAPPMQQLMNRQQGAMMERFLRANPFGRQQLEMALGGKILSDGIDDGKIRIQQQQQGQFPGGGISNTAANGVMGALGGLNQAALASPFPVQQGTPNMFNNAMLGGLANVLGGLGGQGGGFPGPMGDLMQMQGLNPAGIIGGQGVAPQGIGTLPGIENPILNQALGAGALPGLGGGGFPQLGGGGFGGGIPPQIGNNPTLPGVGNGAGALGQIGGGDFLGNAMNDPSLTVEDKVTLLLMQIMKKLDKEIEQQANNLQNLQAQGGGQGGAGGAQGMGGMGGQGGQTPSIDVESMKLKRLIDKRNQMFDTLRQIVDKYNQTAKGIIDTVSR